MRPRDRRQQSKALDELEAKIRTSKFEPRRCGYGNISSDVLILPPRGSRKHLPEESPSSCTGLAFFFYYYRNEGRPDAFAARCKFHPLAAADSVSQDVFEVALIMES